MKDPEKSNDDVRPGTDRAAGASTAPASAPTPTSAKLRTSGTAGMLREAAGIVVGAVVIALAVNALRPSGSIPLIQRTPYDIVVPCPEPVGDAQPTSADDPRLTQSSSLVIDARSQAEFEAFHVPGAINVPFDWLGPPVEAETADVARRVARSHAHAVIVYGDGDDPDSGREWARLLAGGGIKNVFHVQGGAPALRAKSLPPEGVKP